MNNMNIDDLFYKLEKAGCFKNEREDCLIPKESTTIRALLSHIIDIENKIKDKEIKIKELEDSVKEVSEVSLRYIDKNIFLDNKVERLDGYIRNLERLYREVGI